MENTAAFLRPYEDSYVATAEGMVVFIRSNHLQIMHRHCELYAPCPISLSDDDQCNIDMLEMLQETQPS